MVWVMCWKGTQLGSETKLFKGTIGYLVMDSASQSECPIKIINCINLWKSHICLLHFSSFIVR